MTTIYFVNVQEILEKVMPVEANSADEAMDIVKQYYANEKIVLDETNYIETNFSIVLDDFQYRSEIKSKL